MTFRYPSLGDYSQTYQSGRLTPIEVMQRALAAVERSEADDPPLRAILHVAADRALQRAAESTARHRRGQPLSVLDGVPVAVKDNLEMAGEPTSNGTRIDFGIPQKDAWIIRHLEELGAIVCAKANLHELGGGTTGINPSRGTARNPHDPTRWCGGSSSGSACAVAAGLFPMTIGTDAGGSIRAPAAFCGVVGLKPTFGRISRVGLSVICDTLDHLGPMATSVADAALSFALLAQSCPDDPETWDQPALEPVDRLMAELRGVPPKMRVGFARPLLGHPRVDPEVATQIDHGAVALRDAGIELVEIEVPSLEDCMDIGLLILAAEGPSGHEGLLYANEHFLGADLQVLLRVGEHVSARDYMHAQRMRQRIRLEWQQVLEEVDAVYLPGPVTIAGRIHADALKTGELDEVTSMKAIATTFPSNLTGFPAITVPCGWVRKMPVSAQFVARPWNELTLLKLASALERSGLWVPRRPQRYFGDDLLA